MMTFSSYYIMSILLNFCDHIFYLNYPGMQYIRNVKLLAKAYVHVFFNFCFTTVICAIQDLCTKFIVYIAT